MNLRRKLLITFGALAMLGLLVAAVSVWATLRWEATNQELREHYTRSLQAQRIRATTFEAFKEIPDALGENDPDARQEFEETLKPVDGDFELWRNLVRTEEERRQVEAVRESYDALVRDARLFFDLLEEGRREEAAELADGEIEEADFEAFQRATERAVASDQAVRDDVRARTEDTRRTAQLVLVVASFGTVSLLLLLAAYLASDLFRPLREIEQALGDVEKGDLDRRLDERRADELGAVNRAFNRMAEAICRRERAEGLGEAPVAEDDAAGGSAWRSAPSRVTLHRLVSGVRSRVAQLAEKDGAGVEERELMDQLDRLSRTVVRVTEFGFPLDLNLTRTDVRALLYEVLARYGGELAERNVSVEVDVDPGVDYEVVDRLKLREVISELVGNALAALPERGGRLGLRARLASDGAELLIEVADDGAGAEQSLIDATFDAPEADGDPQVGLNMSRAIVGQHGGRLGVDSEPGQGTYAQVRLPLRR